MDINESVIKEEVSNLISSLQKLLPRKKDLIVIENDKPLTRLSDVHAEAKKVFPKCFVGAKMVVTRDILEKVKLVQHYNLGKSRDSYKCFSQLIHKEMDQKNVADGLLLDSAGSATATYTTTLEDYEMKLTSKIKDLVSSETEISFEKDSKKSFRSMSLALKDVDPNTLKVVTQWIYKVSPEFSVGSEMGFKPLSYPLSPDLSISARYEKPSFTLSSTISRAGYQVCFFKPFSSDLRIATIVNENNRGGSATLGLALHKSYENAELKIFVDSQRCGGFTFEKDVLFNELHNDVRVVRLMASTIIDRQKRVRFGFGFNLDF